MPGCNQSCVAMHGSVMLGNAHPWSVIPCIAPTWIMVAMAMHRHYMDQAWFKVAVHRHYMDQAWLQSAMCGHAWVSHT